MDVVVTGRHCELSDRFRSHVTEKLSRLEKHDHRIIRVQVEVEQERNPRQADRAVRVELTAFSKGPVIRAEAAAEEKMGALDLALDKMAAQMRRAADRRREHKHKHDRAVRLELTAFSKGPVIRAEACAADKMAALDLALDKMAAQMRRAADRRRVHHGRHAPVSVGQALADIETTDDATVISERRVGPITVTGDGPLVVREKTHPASPMTLDQALYEMELVGHDFFLFVDAANGRPSVVYRRKGWDYGVIGLDVER